MATIVQVIQAEEQAWQAFRRALRIEDRAQFDRLWTHVRHHAVPASMANRPVPMEAILMAMVVGLAKEIEEVRRRTQNGGEPATAAKEAGHPAVPFL